MTKAIVLNPNGQLETTQILPYVAFRPELHFKEVTYPTSTTVRVSYYKDSTKTVELYRITLTRTGGLVTARVDTDYTQNLTRTTSYIRTGGLITSVEVT